MGEPAPSAILEVVFRHLACPLLKQVAPQLGCENAMTKVRRMLLRIQAVLADAEDRQERDAAVRSWLHSLKAVIWDADDLFDEMTIRAPHLMAGSEDDDTNIGNGDHDDNRQVSASFPDVGSGLAAFDFGERINGIAERLDEVARGRADLHLNEVAWVNRGVHAKEGRERWPVVDGSTIFGREADKENLLRLLVSDESRRRALDVVPVIGTAGVGKTALTRLVFDDEILKKYFKQRIWVSVSPGTDVRKLMKAIIESASGDRYVLLGVEAMQRHLRQILSGKRYLLVLDDVRVDNCADWDKLHAALISGATGSKILLTTASQTVAEHLGSRSSCQLRGLSFEDCWSLFSLCAFGGHDVGDTDPDLVLTGKEIVKKCKGSPLSVKALGSLLHNETDGNRWRHILKNQSWNEPGNKSDSFPALRLCYVFLPLHLKQCFLYCSVLPKKLYFGKDVLIRLWMAQGFILCKGGERMEDLGMEYFDELLGRSFLQFSHIDSEDGEPKFFVHEVIHELMRSLSGEECCWIASSDPSEIPSDMRHMLLDSSQIDNLSTEDFSESHGLRTLLLEGECKVRELQLPQILFLNLRCLRVLDLGNTSLHVLPGSIGDLVLLRYLSLFNTKVEKLPESLGELFVLQTLDLGDCFELKALPEGIVKLTNLRHLNLELHQCRISGLSAFPSGFRHLTSLQTLSTFVVGSNGECQIWELKDLEIHGRLCISKLDKVASEAEAKKSSLRNKRHLKKLELQWHSAAQTEVGLHEKVLENLQPHFNLKELVIRGYGGVTFPNWMADPRFINLITVSISDCPEFEFLPALGQLPFLKYLAFERVAVKHIGPEFCANGKVTSFPSLETLKFENLSQWEDWSGIGEGDMPSLRELCLIGCSNVRCLPNHFSALKKLEIWNCFVLTSLPKLPSLHSLVLRGPTRSLLGNLSKLTCLHHLEIKNCPELSSLPRDLKSLSKLHSLVIHDCKQLSSLPDELCSMTALESLEISGCSQLQTLPNGGLPPELQFLSISSCPSLSKRFQGSESEDWIKLASHPSVCIDGQNISLEAKLEANSI